MIFVIVGDLVVVCGDGMAVLLTHPWKAGKSIEADDDAIVIEGFVEPAQRTEQRHVLPPAHAELHDNAVDVDNLAIKFSHIEDARQRLAAEVKSEIVHEIVGRQRRALQQFHQLPTIFLVVRGRTPRVRHRLSGSYDSSALHVVEYTRAMVVHPNPRPAIATSAQRSRAEWSCIKS